MAPAYTTAVSGVQHAASWSTSTVTTSPLPGSVALVLCTVPDQAAPWARSTESSSPAGPLRILEHVRADSPGLVLAQRALDATIWPHLAGGCHTGRDTATAIEHAGFTIPRLHRFRFPNARTPISFYIRGIGVRPEEASPFS